MTERYDPKEIEQRWQRVWQDERAFHTPNPEPGQVEDDKTYVVEMLPYPSGELHMGHVLNYTIGDVVVHLRVAPAARRRLTPPEQAWELPAFDRYDDEVDPAALADAVVLADQPDRPALVLAGRFS